MIRRKNIYLHTFVFDHLFKESLLIITFGDDIYKNIILLPKSFDLVVLNANGRPLPMPGGTVSNESFLSDVITIG